MQYLAIALHKIIYKAKQRKDWKGNIENDIPGKY